MSKLPVKFCPPCGSKLEREPGHYGRNCNSCKHPCGDDTQEAVHGHYVCSGDKAAGKRCDFHYCVSCFYGVDEPVVVIGPYSCSNTQCTRTKDSIVVPCTHTGSEAHKTKPSVPYCWVWDGAEAGAKCPLCLWGLRVKPGRSTAPCGVKDCGGTRTILWLGQPRTLPDRRPRSPSPQNVKREPSSSSSSDDDEEEQQEAPKKKQPAPKKKPAAKAGRKKK